MSWSLKSNRETTMSIAATIVVPRRIAFLASGKCEPERPGPRNDVESLSGLLVDASIGECECRSLPDCPDDTTYLSQLNQVLDNWNPVNQLILYFAGHGKTNQRLREWCLLFGPKNESELPFNWVLDKLRMKGVSRGIILLDACYSGQVISPDRGSDELFKDLPTGFAFVVSAGRLEFAYDKSDLSGGVFTKLLCLALRTGLGQRQTCDEKISVEDLMRYMEREGPGQGLKQQPHYELRYVANPIWIAHNVTKGRAELPRDVAASGATSLISSEPHLGFDRQLVNVNVGQLMVRDVEAFLGQPRARRGHRGYTMERFCAMAGQAGGDCTFEGWTAHCWRITLFCTARHSLSGVWCVYSSYGRLQWPKPG